VAALVGIVDSSTVSFGYSESRRQWEGGHRSTTRYCKKDNTASNHRSPNLNAGFMQTKSMMIDLVR
jgi:hypothetical protein